MKKIITLLLAAAFALAAARQTEHKRERQK